MSSPNALAHRKMRLPLHHRHLHLEDRMQERREYLVRKEEFAWDLSKTCSVIDNGANRCSFGVFCVYQFKKTHAKEFSQNMAYKGLYASMENHHLSLFSVTKKCQTGVCHVIETIYRFIN